MNQTSQVLTRGIRISQNFDLIDSFKIYVIAIILTAQKELTYTTKNLFF